MGLWVWLKVAVALTATRAECVWWVAASQLAWTGGFMVEIGDDRVLQIYPEKLSSALLYRESGRDNIHHINLRSSMSWLDFWHRNLPSQSVCNNSFIMFKCFASRLVGMKKKLSELCLPTAEIHISRVHCIIFKNLLSMVKCSFLLMKTYIESILCAYKIGMP